MAKQEVFAATWKALSISGRSKEIVATEIQTLCLMRTDAIGSFRTCCWTSSPMVVFAIALKSSSEQNTVFALQVLQGMSLRTS